MTARGRGYGQSHDWESTRDDYSSSVYDPQYPDDSASGGVQLDHCRLYITNVPRALNEEGLRAAFSKYGTLSEAHLSKDPNRKYGLVRYETPGEAKLAMMKMNRTEPLKLNVSIAHKPKMQDEHRKPSNHKHERASTNGTRDRGGRDDASVLNRNRYSRQQEVTNNCDEMDDIPADDDFGYNDTLDPQLHLELENLKLEQLKLREEQLMCKHRMILLKQVDKKPQLTLNSMSNRCILPDGKIVVRNVNRAADTRDTDVNYDAGAGDSNETTVCSCKRTKTWRCTDGSSTPSTCVLCCEHPNEKRDKSTEPRHITRKTPSRNIKPSNCSKITGSVSKKSDATSKKEMKGCKCKSEATCDLKYSELYSDSEDEDETNRLIQMRNADYMDIVGEDLKLVIALAGYPKSRMRLRQMEQFQNSLSEIIDMHLKAGFLKRVPSFLDYYLNRGALVCICKDLETRDWVVRVSPGLQERMCTNLVLLRAKVKRLCLAILRIPKSCWPATAQDAFKLLQYFNPALKTNLWKIYSQKILDDIETTSFLIDRVSGEIIRGPNFKNVIDYEQMEFELTGYTEIYHECLLSGMEEDIRSVASRVKLLEELKSAEATPRNSDECVKNIEDKEMQTNEEKNDEIDVQCAVEELVDIKNELESSLQKDVLKKLKDVTYISDKDEVLVWSDETNNYNESDEKTEEIKEQDTDNNITSASVVAVSDKTESFVESNDNLIVRSSNLNIDSNRGIAYHRRTNYLHVDDELKVAITLEGYPQNKLEGTHIRRLKHLFKEYLHKDMKMQRFSNLIIPKFQDIYLSNGAVIYVCDSLETKDYLTEVLSKFLNSTGLKLTFRNIKCLVRYTRIVMRLPKEFAHVESVEILLKLQLRYPKLKPDCWKYYSDVAGKQKRQFGVDPESLEVIKSSTFDPTYEGEKLTFRVIDRQKRDVSVEETSNVDVTECGRQRDVLKYMFVAIDPEIMGAPLTRVRTNHYSDLIADDLKLYVGPSNYPESRIDESQFHSIKRIFENIVIDRFEKGDLDVETVPKLHDMYLFDGVIFIICQNIGSRGWVENAIPLVNSKLHISLKATEFRGAVGIISMMVKTDKDTNEVIALLQEKNPRLRTKYWRKISTVRTKAKLDVVLQIDKLSAQVITGPNFDKLIGANVVQFKLGHLQSLLKPKLSLEQLSKLHAKKLEKKNKEWLKKSKLSVVDTKEKGLKKEEIKSVPLSGIDKQTDNNDENEFDSRTIEKASKINLFYTNDSEDFDPIIIEPDCQGFDDEFVSPDQQDYVKIFLKIPPTVLPGNEDDLNIIFDLLEDQNPGLNTELWHVYTESVYPGNGKFTIYVDKRSISVLQGQNFDCKIGGEKLMFFF